MLQLQLQTIIDTYRQMKNNMRRAVNPFILGRTVQYINAEGGHVKQLKK